MFKGAKEGDNLESLARDSWQLELLVTGFALAGMLSGWDEISHWADTTLDSLGGRDVVSGFAGGLIVCATFAYLIVLANFFFHVVLRCLWIGAIGSRSVMGNTVIARKKLAPRFERFLRRRSGNFDRYIAGLDDAASLVFSFTFLLIVATLSTLTTLFALAGISYLTQVVPRDQSWVMGVIVVLLVLYAAFSLLYFVDFLTAGYFKRFRLLSRVYYPVYRLFGWITLARVYRPLYYNLLSRRGGRILILLLIPYLAIGLAVLTLELAPNRYVAKAYLTGDENTPFTLNARHYQDNNPEHPAIGELVIDSEVIHTSPLRVSIPLLSFYESYIARRCPNLPEHYTTSLYTELFSEEKTGRYEAGEWVADEDALITRDALDCMSSAVELFLDGRRLSLDDVLLSRPDDQPRIQLIKFIPLDGLEAGLHELRLRQLTGPSRRRPDDTLRSVVTVPFYYAPN